MQRTDVKSRYKALVRKRWTLMGALAGCIEGVETNDTNTAVRTMEELAEVSVGLDQLADELYSTIEQLAQLKSLREVHHASALAMALRKVNSSFVKQMAEKERLNEQVEVLEAERDEAWKHAEDVAQDYDTLNDRMMESIGDAQPNDDAKSTMSSRRSVRVSAVRRSSIRQSKAGLRMPNKRRSGRSSISSVGNRGSFSFPTSDHIPPVPPLPLQLSGLSAATSPATGLSPYSSATSGARALSLAQKELYEMLGLPVPDTVSESSSRPRTLSASNLHHTSLHLRPMSEGGTGASIRPRSRDNRATHSVIFDDVSFCLSYIPLKLLPAHDLSHLAFCSDKPCWPRSA
ncbi:hypothetical protein BU15DRAFT_54815 [Melanogaster broomeanus]|nr:hypothetical protein BU15DRAFT_54815 [Melanogaster broomeanus]